MRIGALFSGGKDSTYAILKARKAGHDVSCLITIRPVSDESTLLHHPNGWITKYQSEAMTIPLVEVSVSDSSLEKELNAIQDGIRRAKREYGIEGIVHGGIASEYQRRNFFQVCAREGLSVIAPLWHVNPRQYMGNLIESGFEVIVVSVSAMGLDMTWLGKRLDMGSIEELERLSLRFGFNLTFEGGEAETIVSDCPIFHKRLQIKKSSLIWDGQRGTFEILEVALVNKDV